MVQVVGSPLPAYEMWIEFWVPSWSGPAPAGECLISELAGKRFIFVCTFQTLIQSNTYPTIWSDCIVWAWMFLKLSLQMTTTWALALTLQLHDPGPQASCSVLLDSQPTERMRFQVFFFAVPSTLRLCVTQEKAIVRNKIHTHYRESSKWNLSQV